MAKKLGALTLAFFIYTGFLLGLFQFKVWMVPITLGLLSLVFVLYAWKGKF